MSNEFYEKYRQKGGTYVIPVEIFDELLEENKKLKESIIIKDKLISSLNDFNYKLKQQYELLELNYLKQKKENKILKENAENNDKVVDKVNWENQLLKKENKELKEVLKNIRNKRNFAKI